VVTTARITRSDLETISQFRSVSNKCATDIEYFCFTQESVRANKGIDCTFQQTLYHN
jgi:hypothetical protein